MCLNFTVKVLKSRGHFFLTNRQYLPFFRKDLILRIKHFCLLKYWDYQFSRGIYFGKFGLLVKLNTLEIRLDGTKINGENEASC